MFDEHWTVAYRKRIGSTDIVNNTSSPFTAIPNGKRYWCADPFVYTYKGTTYIFSEMYDKRIFRGVIGYCKLTNEGATPWKVILREQHHLSYPFILEAGGSVYMIPESYVANEISLYRAVSFPDKWEKVKPILSDYCTVDSTLFYSGGVLYMLTLNVKGEPYIELFTLDDEFNIKSHKTFSSMSESQSRPAGKPFMHGDQLIRPAQDCSEGYGCALNFYRIDKLGENNYEETLIKKITPSDIVCSDIPFKPEGIHTYNIDENYEVTDLKTYKKVHFPFLRRVYRAINYRILKVLGK